jgi:DNA-binding NarL/FixJ family response regulator
MAPESPQLCVTALLRVGRSVISNLAIVIGPTQGRMVNRAGTLPLTRILIVDDHGIVREGLTVLIERHTGMSVVGAVSSGKDAVLAAVRLKPDLVIMDLVLRDMNGTDAIERILNVLPATQVIVLSACRTAEHVYRSLRAGARGYVVKDGMGAELMQAVLAVTAGKQFFSPDITPVLVDGAAGGLPLKSPMERLSAREREVLHRIVDGSSSADIAAHLSLSRKTVDTYRTRLMVKLGVGNRSALIRLAIEHEMMAP